MMRRERMQRLVQDSPQYCSPTNYNRYKPRNSILAQGRSVASAIDLGTLWVGVDENRRNTRNQIIHRPLLPRSLSR